MAQRCKRLVCTRDVPHKLIVERARGAPALLGPGVPSGTSSSSIPDCSVKTLKASEGAVNVHRDGTTKKMDTHVRFHGTTHDHHSTVSESGTSTPP
jgi:hypothetical protein